MGLISILLTLGFIAFVQSSVLNNQNLRAIVPDGLCRQRLEDIRRSKENGIPLIGVDEPTCDDNGNYAAVQCFGSVCYCVDGYGSKLQSYESDIGSLASMNCECARDEHRYLTSTAANLMFFDCDTNGNYKLTTVAPVPTTEQPPVVTQGPLVTDAPAGTHLISGAQLGTAGECTKALMAAQNSSLLGVFVPNCDADGKYAPRQCQGSECYCVRKDGSKIEGYSSPIAMKDKVTCQCARDKDWFDAMGLLGRIHTCRHNGNYQEYQCLGSVCYCTDDNGDRMESQSVSIGNIGELNCN